MTRARAADRYPLTWPSGWKRTAPANRRRATFSKVFAETKTEKQWNAARQVYEDVPVKHRRSLDLNSADAADRLEHQLDALGASDAILSTNLVLRIDGRPKSNVSDPIDVGAAVYFRFSGQDRVLACDKWDRVADNIAALAAHIDALRRIDRYGVGDMNQAFAGYVGLPARGTTWRTTLGFAPDAVVTREDVQRAFRDRARDCHPDRHGGSHNLMASLTEAKADAERELR